MRPLRIGLVGVGKIARDQHIPALAADPGFELVATASHGEGLDGIPGHRSIEAMIAGGHALDAVALCTPPAGRHDLARTAIAAGLHVMLEKPPAATLGEAADLADRAQSAGVSLFASWHSRAAAAVDPARRWLRDRAIRSIAIEWLEDIRVWHPGQDWILGTGGFGVFDPGINALSILTALLPDRVRIDGATLDIPSNRVAPIAATLNGQCGDADFKARFDSLWAGPPRWTIEIETGDGPLRLTDGGSRWSIGDTAMPIDASSEYAELYRRFAMLIHEGRSDADFEPLRIVADALLQGTPLRCAAFHF